MKEQLEKQSLELLTWLEQTIKTTANFTAEQIPLFVQELLRYHYWMSLSYFILGLVGTISTIWSGCVYVKWCLKDDGDKEDCIPFVLFWIVPLAVSIITFFNNVEWIMIQLAPRLFLLEYVKELIKH